MWVILSHLSEKEIKDIDEIKGQGRKRKMNENEETEKLHPYCCKDRKSCPTVGQYQLRCPSDASYRTPSPLPTTLVFCQAKSVTIFLVSPQKHLGSLCLAEKLFTSINYFFE